MEAEHNSITQSIYLATILAARRKHLPSKFGPYI
jgi:hypothetical protein